MKLPVEQLLFRRQFVLGPRFLEGFGSWSRVRVRDAIRITSHPDLNVTHLRDGEKSVTHLGYLLDPSRPEASDGDLVSALLRRLCAEPDADAAVEWTYGLAGRWVLIFDDGRAVRLFHDAMGLRTVYFTDRSLLEETWCASQPGQVAVTLGLSRDAATQRAFVDSNLYRGSQEARWPGDRSESARPAPAGSRLR
jgi:hypothetical protein